MLRHNGVHFFDISTSKSAPELLCASRHNGVHFFDISTSKSAPELLCFVHFDFRMCFAPQRRAEESEKRKSQKKAPKGREIAKHSVFPMVCGSGASKSRLAKAAGAEPSGQMRDEKLHAVVARNVQITPFSDHFWKLRCRKSARRCGNTFPSQNVQSTPCLDHFWKLRCRKSARRWGAKHICK